MNWYKQIKLSSSLGQTIGKWLEYAKYNSVDPSTLMSDVHQALQDDSETIMDPGILNLALNEANAYLQRTQADPYNSYQQTVVDLIQNMTNNPSNPSATPQESTDTAGQDAII